MTAMGTNSVVSGSRMERDPHRGVHDADAASAALSLCALGHRPINEVTMRPSLVPATALPTPAPPCIAGPPCRQTVGAPPFASLAAPRRNTMRPRDPKRDTGVHYEEMKRLMRVYGPLTCLRNRVSKETGRAAQPASIKVSQYKCPVTLHN